MAKADTVCVPATPLVRTDICVWAALVERSSQPVGKTQSYVWLEIVPDNENVTVSGMLEAMHVGPAMANVSGSVKLLNTSTVEADVQPPLRYCNRMVPLP